MKKIALFLGLLAIATIVNAQVSTVKDMTATSYTVTNGATVNLDLKYNGDPAKGVSFQYVGTKVSGTVAGTATLKGSIDGTNYVSLPVDAILDTTNAYTNTNVATNSRIWVVHNSPYLYYRVAVTGSGTMVLIVHGYAFPK